MPVMFAVDVDPGEPFLAVEHVVVVVAEAGTVE